jgi:hypothetical protein
MGQLCEVWRSMEDESTCRGFGVFQCPQSRISTNARVAGLLRRQY